MRAPPPEAYGRVTNPDRFRPLWTVAEDLIQRLARDYRVAREDRADLDSELVAGVAGEVKRVVRLAPSIGDGAPLAVAFTGFPGLRVRFGRWHVEGFPVCGCDACDEQPEELADDLLEKVNDLVSGDFAESVAWLRHPGVSYSFGRGTGWSSLSRVQARRLGAPRSINWPAWQPTR